MSPNETDSTLPDPGTPTPHYEALAVGGESTVVAEYQAEPTNDTAYQSEADLEAELIRILQAQAYEYLPITSEAELIANLRTQLESLNHITFSDSEWQRFFTQSIAGKTDGIIEKTARIQEDHVQLLKRDDGSTKNITLIDKDNIHNNHLQVINQYEVAGKIGRNPTSSPSFPTVSTPTANVSANVSIPSSNAAPADSPANTSATATATSTDLTNAAAHFPTPAEHSRLANYSNRYDVTILVNGLPLVHIELKRRGVDIREAFNQIDRYQRDSFWAGSGLFEYVQLFVISNGTLTKYYSNTTRRQHLKETSKQRPGKAKTSHSFEFTSWWADAQNHQIRELTAFAKTFFAKHTLLNILTKYCVFTVDRLLLAMRPYQIVATERILQRIQIASNYKRLGRVDAGGYIWHTTGSGKTLTSFKTAQLAAALPMVEKVLFVVDRKDLDYQTMREYDRFQKGAANSNTSTAVLKTQLEDSEARIIITTIQKLSTFVKSNPAHPVFTQHVVLIFDECHRSQFGEMHTEITRAFKRYSLFGFTGTPIFPSNAGSGANPRLKTTEQAFGDKLHTYTIVDAITDKNVLPFRIDYVNTIQVGNVIDAQVTAIDTEKALLAPERIAAITRYILQHFDQKTKRSTSYEYSVVQNVAEVATGRKHHNEYGNENAKERARRRERGGIAAQTQRQHVNGFNAILATASIDAARRYYNQFALQQADLPPQRRLKVAVIYSFGANDPTEDFLTEDEGFDTGSLSDDARQFLDDAICDYNEMFATNYDTSADKFESYYKDLSLRMKNREVDLAIVVNMFLTGFDATTLNTLFVDKNLRAHGLIQAYSRTNRILNSVKTYGNIVAFRDLESATNEALELFGNKNAHGVVLLKPYADYFHEYAEKITQLLDRFPLGQPIISEDEQKQFITLFGHILRLENILTCFDNFAADRLLSERQSQDYRSIYLDLYAEYRQQREVAKTRINDDLRFEIELIKQVEINVDYILMLVERYRQEHGDGENQEIRAAIRRAVDASPSLRNKRDLIEAFVDSVSPQAARQSDQSSITAEWQEFMAKRYAEELDDIIRTENLRPQAAREFMNRAFQDGELATSGTAIVKILPPTSRFAQVKRGLPTSEPDESLTSTQGAVIPRDGAASAALSQSSSTQAFLTPQPSLTHAEKKSRVTEKLQQFFDRFFGVIARPQSH
ncbi:type I restriction endonuclease subunit R [Trueperella sp. LYQ141]|uniref:type I restriction endonuclease subunit R n=1 Tax=Trueperella sp. LYQ141 TaxID=3391058 RepID=UPI003983CFDD